jgi:hypothetical protein
MDFSIEDMYYSDRFQTFLDKQTYKKAIREREDFKHDVFAEIIASDCTSIGECKAAAQRVGRQYQNDAKIDTDLIDRSIIV